MSGSFIELCFQGNEQPQTRRGFERRQALLICAMQLFLEKGYDAVSLDDVVNYAGGSKTSIYKYFGNKEGLFKAICDYRRDLFFQGVCIPFEQSLVELKTYLTETLIRFYQHIIQTDNIAFLRLVIEQSQRNPELSTHLYSSCTQNMQRTIAEALEKAHRSGHIVCNQPQFSAKIYFGILRDLEWRVFLGLPEEKKDLRIHDYIQYSVDMFLKAHQKA